MRTGDSEVLKHFSAGHLSQLEPNVITYIVAMLPYSIFSDTIHFSARSFTYEMLRWAVLTDHYFVSGLLYSSMSELSLRTLRFEDWCSHLVICREVSDTQFGVSVFSLDRWWFKWIICMVMTQHLLYCVMVTIALILIFVTYTSI